MSRVEPQTFRYAITPATYTGLVTVDECRAYSIIDTTSDTPIDTADAALIQLIIDSALQYWIDYTGVFPLHTVITAQLDFTPCVPDCWLRHDPIFAVSKIWGLDTDATEYELDAADYVIDNENAIIRSLEWPTGDKDLGSFNITYTSGLAALVADVPQDCKLAIKQMVTHWFEIRQPTSEMSITLVPQHAIAIMEKYKPRSI